MHTLYARPGWGSAIVELQLAHYAIPHEIIDLDDLFASEAARARLAPLNPITQVPTLVLPNGEVLTESAAITLHLADLPTGRPTLVPPPGDPTRPAFLRWLVFMVANIYPTFTYADVPARFIDHEPARQSFRDKVDAYARRLWLQVEAAAQTPWFTGPTLTAMDLYIAVMTQWRPNRVWFEPNTPKLFAIAKAVEAVPEFAAVWQRNTRPATGDAF
jgi:GST-like protein